jgi:hypothetical protein
VRDVGPLTSSGSVCECLPLGNSGVDENRAFQLDADLRVGANPLTLFPQNGAL